MQVRQDEVARGILFRLAQVQHAARLVAGHAEHERVLRKQRDAALGEIALDGIQIKGLIGATDREQMAVQLAARNRCAHDSRRHPPLGMGKKRKALAQRQGGQALTFLRAPTGGGQ